jgi:hypothetical protein
VLRDDDAFAIASTRALHPPTRRTLLSLSETGGTITNEKKFNDRFCAAEKREHEPIRQAID